MRGHRPSRTAEHNALFRAIESSRPPQERMISDPIAFHFLDVPFRLTAFLSRSRAGRALLCRYIDNRWLGSRTSLIARTRWIDDYVTAAVASGVRQIVLLGAGFDSRAYRIPGVDRAKFFEVDHPNTSVVKRSHVNRGLGTLPTRVKYVPVDFERQSVQRALEDQDSGFDATSRALFLWEGVSNYLTEESVRATLLFLSGLSPGTQLIFTYVDEGVILDPSAFKGGREVQGTFAKLDEPWTFGIRPDRAGAFFSECGLCLDSDLSAPEYRRLYYRDCERIKGYEFYHLVTAHVPSSEDRLRAGQIAEAQSA